jgi:hypothetical protein
VRRTDTPLRCSGRNPTVRAGGRREAEKRPAIARRHEARPQTPRTSALRRSKKASLANGATVHRGTSAFAI